MAELAPRERLQPSLLDRLADDEPGQAVESRERRVLSLKSLRACVLRDLQWLLNTTNLLSVVDLPALPYVAGSVLNYGMPDLSGIALDGLDVTALERGIRQAIRDFEPRLVRSTVNVRALSSDPGHNKIMFEIVADMWAQPYPERLYLKTELDLDRGAIRLAATAEGR